MFVGQRSDVVRCMGAGDVFAMPWFGEPFGIVFAEAMAMELPGRRALNNGGTPEVVEHGKAGLLSDPGDIAALAEQPRHAVPTTRRCAPGWVPTGASRSRSASPSSASPPRWQRIYERCWRRLKSPKRFSGA